LYILPVVSYESEAWSPTLREEHRLRVFENGVLRKICKPKREEVTQDWRKMHSDDLHDLCSSLNVRVVKEAVMGVARCTHWVKRNARNACTGLVGESE
jgi:predicted neuraminidase